MFDFSNRNADSERSANWAITSLDRDSSRPKRKCRFFSLLSFREGAADRPVTGKFHNRKDLRCHKHLPVLGFYINLTPRAVKKSNLKKGYNEQCHYINNFD